MQENMYQHHVHGGLKVMWLILLTFVVIFNANFNEAGSGIVIKVALSFPINYFFYK